MLNSLTSVCRLILPERRAIVDNESKPKYAIFINGFHGETWYRCPHCYRSFEFYDTQFERDFKRTNNPKEFIHLPCKGLVKIR